MNDSQDIMNQMSVDTQISKNTVNRLATFFKLVHPIKAVSPKLFKPAGITIV